MYSAPALHCFSHSVRYSDSTEINPKSYIRKSSLRVPKIIKINVFEN